MALGKKKGAIGPHSGGLMCIKEVKEDGTDLAVPDTWHVLGYLAPGTKVTPTVETEDVADETGLIIKVLENSQMTKITGNLLQADKDTLDLLGLGCKGKFYALYRYEGIVNAFYQEFFFSLIQFKRGFDLENGKKQPPFEITAMPAPAAVTIDSADLPDGAHTTADVVIPAGQEYIIVETAVA